MGDGGDQTTALARIAVAVLGLAAVVLIFSILGDSEGASLNSKVLSAVISFVPFSLIALAGFRLIERKPQLILLGLLTIILSAAAYFVLLDAFWSNGFEGRHVARGTLLIIVLAAGQASMLLSFGRDDDSPLVNGVLLGTLSVLGLLSLLAVVEISDPGQDVDSKLFAILSVLYLLGILLRPLLRQAEFDT
jgi:hypothetical protein